MRRGTARLTGTAGGLLLALLLLFVPTPVLLPTATHAGEPRLEAGFAVVDLTPDEPVPLGGYAARLGALSNGVHDRIEARAMVLREGSTSLALVTLDLVGVSDDVRRLVMHRVRDLGLDEVVLAASHTHAGPGALSPIPLWTSAMGPFDGDLYLRVVARIEVAVRLAWQRLAPARLAAARAPAAGLVRNRRTAGGLVDDTVGVVRVEDEEGRLRGAVVHFAAHPILIPHTVRSLSAGWPGRMRAALEEQAPDATVLFLQGAVGDVSPRVPEGTGDDPFERADAYGRVVARAAWAGLEALDGRETDAGALEVFGTATAERWTVAGTLLGRREASALTPEQPFALPVTRFALGGVTLVTVPGEPTQGTARVLGQDEGRWVVGCAQGHFGYFAHRALFRRGGSYEAEMSFFGPGAAEGLARAARGESPPRPVRTAGAAASTTAPIQVLPRAGATNPARDLGRSHGERLGREVRDLLGAAETHIVREAMRGGAGLKLLPISLLTGVRARHLVIPLLVRKARELQRHIPAEYLDEMEGLAEAAGVPYDAVLLENVFLTLSEQPDPASLLDMPARCTNAVLTGEATSAGQLVHLSTLDWGMRGVLKDRTVVLVVEPASGHPFASITWPGMVGTLRAMGAQGLAVTEESCAARDDTRLDGVPVNFLLRDVVQHAAGLDEAVQRVTEARGTCGYKITISDGRALDARVVEVTANHHHVRRPVDGRLWGCHPDAPDACFVGERDPAIRPNDGSSARRYPALERRLAEHRGRHRLPDLLDAISTREGQVLGDGTLLLCAFEPSSGRFHTVLGRDVDPRSEALRWRHHDLRALLSPEARARYTPPWPVTTTDEVEVRTRLPNFGGLHVEAVTFRSPVLTANAANDVFEAELFTPADPVGVVIQLPHWREPRGAPGQRLVALGLAKQGVAVLLMPLPWQYGRAPPGVASGDLTLSADLARTREAAFQAAADVARAGLWLEQERGWPPAKQFLVGTSLGGHLAALALGAYPDRFQGGVFLLASSGTAETLLAKNGVTDRVRERLVENGVTLEEARSFLADVDPARFARPKRAADVLIVAGDADPVTPRHRVEALAAAWGGARIQWFEGGHYAVIRRAGSVMKLLVDHVKSRIETP